jgi:TrmH family RNA methyltransferase
VVDPDGIGDALIDAAMARARAANVPVDILRSGVLGKVADAATPQPIAAVVRGGPGHLDELADAVSFVLVADQTQDPGNLGALVRVAEACGAEAFVVTGSAADPFGPKALRGSAGSSLRVPIIEHADALEVVDSLRARGMTVAVTTPHGGADFAHLNWPSRVALVLGNEAHGLDEELAAAGDLAVAIPMAPGVESLNLSVAAGILAMAIHRGLRATVDGAAGSTIGAMPIAEQP